MERAKCAILLIYGLLSVANCANFGFKQPINSHAKAFKRRNLHGFSQHLGHHAASQMHNIEAARLLASSRWQETQSTSIKSAEIMANKPRIFFPTNNGADPTGGSDSTTALQLTINQAFDVASTHSLMTGVIDLGGVEIHLGGGQYVISKPLTLPDLGGGNVLIHGGTLRASGSFPSDGYLIELASTELREEWERLGGRLAQSHAQPAYENIVLQNLLLDANYTAGGILLLNPLRTTITNCYITHFATFGISVQGGHETLIHTSFLGQHITSGGDAGERNFSGTAILLSGNDNAITDVVIFSAQTGIEIDGQANIITGVHCYNKATGWGGVGIMVRQGAAQTRMLGCYMDYTGIVLEEPNQITISNSFFLGDAFVLLKALGNNHPSPPSVFGVAIVNNMFSGGSHGIPIVQLLGNFSSVKQTFVDGNSATGMTLRSTRARASTMGFGSNWTLDLSQTLLFPDSIAHVHYSFFASTTMNHNDTTSSNTSSFPHHALRSVTRNSITIASDTPVHATVSVYVDQSFYGDNDDDISHLYI